MRYFTFVVPLLALVLVAGAPLTTAAQDTTPSASPSAGAPPVVASGLTNPRGFTWAPDGTLYVALAGNGGTSPAVGDPLPTERTRGWRRSVSSCRPDRP